MRTGIIVSEGKYVLGPVPYDVACREFKQLVTGYGYAELWSSDGVQLRRRLNPPAETKTSTKTMKTLKSVLPLIAILFGLTTSSHAQLIANPISSTYIVNAAGAGSESNLATPLVLDVRGQKDVAMLASFKLMGSGTGAVLFRLYPSVDGSTAAGVPICDFVKAANGTTAVTISTNITVSGYPYLLWTTITNGSATVLTNPSIKWFVKKNAP